MRIDRVFLVLFLVSVCAGAAEPLDAAACPPQILLTVSGRGRVIGFPRRGVVFYLDVVFRPTACLPLASLRAGGHEHARQKKRRSSEHPVSLRAALECGICVRPHYVNPDLYDFVGDARRGLRRRDLALGELIRLLKSSQSPQSESTFELQSWLEPKKKLLVKEIAVH